MEFVEFKQENIPKRGTKRVKYSMTTLKPNTPLSDNNENVDIIGGCKAIKPFRFSKLPFKPVAKLMMSRKVAIKANVIGHA